MKGEIIFLMEMIVVSGIFFFGYKLVFHHASPAFRRWYLLSWLLFSIAFPLITLEIPSAAPVSVGDFVVDSGTVFTDESFADNPTIPEFPINDSVAVSDTEPQVTIDWVLVLKFGYLVVAAFFLLRIALGYFQIRKLRKSSDCLDYAGRKIFEVQDSSFKGASFFRWIFIGNSIGENRNMVLDHEMTHAELHHSVDILLSHFYCALFWINPLAGVLKKNIAINTELETDAHVAQNQDSYAYANLLLDFSQKASGSVIMNHFSAKHLKMRILAMKKSAMHRKWVYYFTTGITLSVFFLISCSNADFSDGVTAEARLNDVKTITTYFTSHQSDTQQKTGKVVAIATFLPDGNLDELVNKTSYPYDHEFETKKKFWTQPIKKNLPFIMDGLSVGVSENNLLYGNNWPSAYAQHLLEKEAERDTRFPWRETYEIDDLSKPTELKTIIVRENTSGTGIFFLGRPDATTYYEYEGDKVSKTSVAYFYPEIDEDNELYKAQLESMKKAIPETEIKKMVNHFSNSGKKQALASYYYDGDLLSRIIRDRYEYRFYYDGNLLTKSEYFIENKLINTRIHTYKNGIPDRTELFNTYNEPEYTITYEYEFWE